MPLELLRLQSPDRPLAATSRAVHTTKAQTNLSTILLGSWFVEMSIGAPLCTASKAREAKYDSSSTSTTKFRQEAS